MFFFFFSFFPLNRQKLIVATYTNGEFFSVEFVQKAFRGLLGNGYVTEDFMTI
jgi:hypothetical protein